MSNPTLSEQLLEHEVSFNTQVSVEVQAEMAKLAAPDSLYT